MEPTSSDDLEYRAEIERVILWGVERRAAQTAEEKAAIDEAFEASMQDSQGFFDWIDENTEYLELSRSSIRKDAAQ